MRKTIIALSVIGFGIAGLTEVSAPTPAGAQEVKGPKITWRMSLWGKRRAFTEAPEYTSKMVSEKTGGNFQIKLYYGQQLSKSKENLDGISVGAFEMASFCAAYHPGKKRTFECFGFAVFTNSKLKCSKESSRCYLHASCFSEGFS